VGRTGRAGRAGMAISIVTSHDTKHLAAIEKLTNQSLEWLDSPLPPSDPEEGERRAPRRSDHKPSPARGPAKEGRGASSHTARPKRRDDAAEAPPRQTRRPETIEATDDREPQATREPRSPRAPQPQREFQPQRELQPPREQQPPREARHSRRPQQEEPAVVGLGDHVPAFLLRPPRIAR
jgi:superfamily II DNA/RNA helicase